MSTTSLFYLPSISCCILTLPSCFGLLTSRWLDIDLLNSISFMIVVDQDDSFWELNIMTSVLT